MDQKKKVRSVLRAGFTKVANELEQCFSNKVLNNLEENWEMLQQKYDSLELTDREVFELMVIDDVSEENLMAEMDSCDNYRRRFVSLKIKYNSLMSEEKNIVESHTLESVSDIGVAGKRKFKLPPIQFKKFSGDIRDWFPFWNQFRKIHEDPNIDTADKIEYLHQATSENSKARRVVESFPAINENYPKMIDTLKSRFGRDDLQIEIYIRELLKLILANVNNKNKIELSLLYDKLETQIRSLSTLGVTADKSAAILFPLIESCLPEEILRAWQRCAEFSTGNFRGLRETGGEGGVVVSGDDLQNLSMELRLKSLMNFLRNEVENEQRISIAAEGFGLTGFPEVKSMKPKSKSADCVVPTAAGLINFNVDRCVFCECVHASENCFKAQNFSFQQKRRILKEKNACFKCLKRSHHSGKCREKVKCVICKKAHVVLVCPDLNSSGKCSGQKVNEKVSDVTTKNTDGVDEDKVLTNQSSPLVLLQTMLVKMYGVFGHRDVRVLIDTGSQRSYVSESTVQEMGYQPKRTVKVIHSLFGGAKTGERSHNCYDIRLGKDKYRCVLEVLDQRVICDNISSVTSGPWIKDLEDIGINVYDTETAKPVEVLLGADVAGKLYTGRKYVLKCGLVAVETLLGWTLMGKIPTEGPITSSALTVVTLLTNDASIASLWELDTLGIVEPTQKTSNEERARDAKVLFLQTISRDPEGRYEVRLPWIEGHPPLLDNYAVARKRLDVTINNLRKKGSFEAYNQVFVEWIEEHIIEQVQSTEKIRQSEVVHYLPHRGVFKEDSTTKIRPVFDASSREKNSPSLNQCLEKGLNLIEFIPDIILKFRENMFGIISDIKKAFLQIGVDEMDRNCLRFLWVDAEGNQIIYRHRRVVFGVNSSPFLLAATIEYHLEKMLEKYPVYSETISRLSTSFYVDNCVTSVQTIEELNRFISESKFLMAEGKFDLRGWEFTNNIAAEVSKLSVLGLCWNIFEDYLTISDSCIKNIINVEGEITKRQILSAAQKIFDPIGFTSPVTLSMKIVLQKVWKQKIGWDDPVDSETKVAFSNWVKNLTCLLEIKVPRWIKFGNQLPKNLSIHVFGDASKQAYATVVFLRTVYDNIVSVYLIAAKARVAPLKEISIPRLELLAATISARLCHSVKKVLGMDIEYLLWTDSTTVLSWIVRSDEWAPFVGNRVKEIRSLSKPESWRHVPGFMNPADLPSRGCSPDQLLSSKWWEGPTWLYKMPEYWPQENLMVDEDEIVKERKKTSVTVMLTFTSDDWHLNYFSKYMKTVQMFAWITRFVYNLKNVSSKISGQLTVDEIDNAEKIVLKLVQQDVFSNEHDNRLTSLRPFCDDSGLIRLSSRVSMRDDTNDFRFPIVLPPKHFIVTRLIFDAHIKACHAGTQTLLSILRERYWVIGGRRTVRSVIRKCVICKRQDGYSIQVSTPPLPLDRVRDAATFEVIGVDFAGPLYLKGNVKSWVCLFTCAIYRAVHIELCSSLSTSCFIQAFRRFVARRGRPKTIYSDNGTNFVGTENLFSKINWKTIAEYSAVERIHWKFNPPTAAWWGGFWERLIGVLKRLLRKVLGRACLEYEELQTVLCDCESIINSRPISFMSDNTDELKPLTPSMFLRDQQESGVPDCDQIDREALCRRLLYKQKLRHNLRIRFRSEYLGQLRNCSKKSSKRKLAVGDVVLIGNDNDKRINWLMARVIELIPGKDDIIRLVRVSTSKGQLLRPVQNIFPLECSLDDQVSSETAKELLPEKCQANLPRLRQKNENSAGVSEVKNDFKSRVPDRKVIITRSGRLSKPPERFS